MPREAPLLLAGLLLFSTTSRAQFDLEAFEIQLDDTIRSACNGYLIDMVPDMLSDLRDWLDEGSPMCAEIRRTPEETNLQDVIREYEPDFAITLPDSERKEPEVVIPAREILRMQCSGEFMCVKTRGDLALRDNPVSQEDYDVVAQSCETALSEYTCIEQFFSNWPQPLPEVRPVQTSEPNSLDVMLTAISEDPTVAHTAPDREPMQNSLDAMLVSTSTGQNARVANGSMDQMLFGANEEIDLARERAAEAARQAEIARLEVERQRAQAALLAEQKRLVDLANRRAQEAAEERERERERSRLLGMGIAIAGGAILAESSGFTSEGKLDFLTRYVSGVINEQDINSFTQEMGSVATAELRRQNDRLRQLDAEIQRRRAEQQAMQNTSTPSAPSVSSPPAVTTVSIPVTNPSSPPQAPVMSGTGQQSCQQASTGPGGVRVGPSNLLSSQFLGTYEDSNCDRGQCHWELNGDGSGTWRVGFWGGAHEDVPIHWYPRVDDQCQLEVATQGDLQGTRLVISYVNPLSDQVKGTMRNSAQEQDYNTLVLLQAPDGRIQAQFQGVLNAFYVKP